MVTPYVVTAFYKKVIKRNIRVEGTRRRGRKDTPLLDNLQEQKRHRNLKN
jgi:hypothetical protein